MLKSIKLIKNNFSTKNKFIFEKMLNNLNFQNRNSLRDWKIINENSIKLRCYDTLYAHTIGDENKPFAVDPEGGPFISIGQEIEINGKKFEIEEILSINNIKVIDINFKVKPKLSDN
jgi:hypothetical protein